LVDFFSKALEELKNDNKLKEAIIQEAKPFIDAKKRQISESFRMNESSTINFEPKFSNEIQGNDIKYELPENFSLFDQDWTAAHKLRGKNIDDGTYTEIKVPGIEPFMEVYAQEH